MVNANSVLSHLSPSLRGTPGPLVVERLEPTRAQLFHALPKTLQGVLRTWNGAFFTDDLWFSTGVETRREGAPPVIGDDVLVELWGFHPGSTGSETDGVPQDLPQEAARQDGEAFLPRGLVAIGLGSQELGGHRAAMAIRNPGCLVTRLMPRLLRTEPARSGG